MYICPFVLGCMFLSPESSTAAHQILFDILIWCIVLGFKELEKL